MTIHVSTTGGYIAIQSIQDQRGGVNVGGWGITIEAAIARCLVTSKEMAK